jgi:hypothetical protein
MVSLVKTFNIDGFRCDLEPYEAGPKIWAAVANRVRKQLKKNILIMAESHTIGEKRRNFDSGGDGFHLSEYDFGVRNPHRGGRDLTNHFSPSIRQQLLPLGGLFYTSTVSSNASGMIHNSTNSGTGTGTGTGTNTKKECAWENCNAYSAQGRLTYFAYGNVISPLLPAFFMGEEFNNPYPKGGLGTRGNPNQNILYFSQMNWQEKFKEENIAFYYRVKKIFEIREAYKDIIAPLEQLRASHTSIGEWAETHLLELPVTQGKVLLKPYAIWGDSGAIALAARKASAPGELSIDLSSLATKWGANRFDIIDLMSDETLVSNLSSADLSTIKVMVLTNDIRLLFVKPLVMRTFTGTDKKPLQIAPQQKHAQSFYVSDSFSKVSIDAPSFGDDQGSLTIKLYRTDSLYDYGKAIQGGAIAEKRFVNFKDNAMLQLSFPAIPAGYYIIEAEAPEGKVGVWSHQGSRYSGPAYLNGNAIDDYDLRVTILKD